MKPGISSNQVNHVAQLAAIPITEAEAQKLSVAFTQTITVISNLQELPTQETEPTHQVTGLENVWREDTVDTDRMFSPSQALGNAQKKHQNYFVVPQIIEQD